MNRKQFIAILIALIVLGGAGLVLVNNHKHDWSVHEAKMGEKVFPAFEPNQVAAIHLQDASTVDVVHSNGVWVVRQRWDYPANFGQISDLLIKLRNLKVVEAEEVDPSELGRVNLNQAGQGNDSGTLVEFRDAQGNIIQSLLAGKQHTRSEDNSRAFLGAQTDGRYILLPANPREVLLISDALNSLHVDPAAWVNKDFIKMEKISAIAVTFPQPSDSWKITRLNTSSPWVLGDAKGGELFNSNQTNYILGALSAPRFTDVRKLEEAYDHLPVPPVIVNVQTFEGFSYTLKLGEKKADDTYPLTITLTGSAVNVIDAERKKLDEKFKQQQTLQGWVYSVNAWSFDPVLKKRAQLLEGAEEPQPARAPASNPANEKWQPSPIK